MQLKIFSLAILLRIMKNNVKAHKWAENNAINYARYGYGCDIIFATGSRIRTNKIYSAVTASHILLYSLS